MDAEIIFTGATWRAKNDVTGPTDYKVSNNSTTYNDFLTDPVNGIPAAPIPQNWHLTAQFLDAQAAAGRTQAQNTETMFSILTNPTDSSATWLARVRDFNHWGNNSTAQGGGGNHPNIGPIANTTNSGSTFGSTTTKVYHDAALGQVASRSSIMRLWYMADPAHHIDLSNATGGSFYQNNNFDNPLVDVATKTVKIDVPAGSPGVYVVFVPERSTNAATVAANPFAKYNPADIITKTIGPNTGAQTFTLTANVGPFINKAVWHYSCLAGYDLTNNINPTPNGPVACAALTGCSDGFPLDCTNTMHSGVLGGAGAMSDPQANNVNSTNGYYATGTAGLDAYYGRFGHKAWEQRQEFVFPAAANCQMPGTDPAITPSTMARGDILAVICLDDHERLAQIVAMGLGGNIETPQ